jgi:transcriptional regulator with XRE-family HTH domain
MQNQTRGNLVRTLREQAGLSQEELAGHAQVSRATVQNIERDRREPRRAVLRRVAEVLGVDAATLTPAIEEPALTSEQIAEKRTELLDALARLDEIEKGRSVG